MTLVRKVSAQHPAGTLPEPTVDASTIGRWPGLFPIPLPALPRAPVTVLGVMLLFPCSVRVLPAGRLQPRGAGAALPSGWALRP